MPACAPPARHVLAAVARLQGRGAGSDMNEAFIQEGVPRGFSEGCGDTETGSGRGRPWGTDGPWGSCLSSFLMGCFCFNDSWFSLGASVLLRQEAASCPPCTLGSGRGSELLWGEVSITTERGCLPRALGGTAGSKLAIHRAVSALGRGSK